MSARRKITYVFDHLAIVVNKKTYAALRATFPFLGWKIVYETDYVGDGSTGMRTFVAKLDKVQLAIMYGVSKKDKVRSQITKYLKRYGNMKLQHIALRTNDIEGAVTAWKKKGVSFLTADKKGTPIILRSEDKKAVVFQCFTNPFADGMFFEIKMIAPLGTQLKNLQEFRDPNIEKLWSAVDRKIKKNKLFHIDLARELARTASLKKI